MIVVYGAAQSYPVPQAPTAPTAESRVVIEAVAEADPQPMAERTLSSNPYNLPLVNQSHPDALSFSIFPDFLTREN